jgi:type II secretory pathway pseudopilin PulG
VTAIELVLVLVLVVSLALIAVPVAAQAIDTGRARHAAGFVTARLRLARMQAVHRTRFVAAVFREVGDRWTLTLCEDGNHNGMSSSEILAGIDPCFEGPYDIAEMFPGTDIAVEPTLTGPEGSPASDDPVRFGASNMTSFSPAGSCTAGTLFLRSRRGVQFAVRLNGVTGRTRILRYDPGAGNWVPG